MHTLVTSCLLSRGLKRAINYDEKDPFLCNACGFCKYAKFDYTLTTRPCCAADPLENQDDRKKVTYSTSIVLAGEGLWLRMLEDFRTVKCSS